MTAHFERVTWAEPRPIAELLMQAQASDVSVLVVEPQSGDLSSDRVDRTVQQLSAANPIVVTRARASESARLRDLPSLLKLIAVLPVEDLAVMDVNFLASHPDLVSRAKSLCELVLLAAESAAIAIEDVIEVDCLSSPERCISLPHLTTPTSGSRAPWLRAIIQRLKVPAANPVSADLVAVKAGLFLLNDFFEESHSNSQSIEGKGPHHTGDYWHAILHRREPDYANSKYWFRHVGRHPVFADLGRSVAARWSSVPGNSAGPLAPWQDRVVPRGDWDPFAFVDLCAAAEQDLALKPWCEQIQYTEMVLLLDWTWNEMQ